MRKFLSLPQEKQDKIVAAAMGLFGNVGYKKAYISEIASAAGISKALIFHYFTNKKGLYSYLVYLTGKVVMTEGQNERDTAGRDFFDRALVTIKFRLSLKSRYPAMDAFIESVYNEDDDEVASDIERLLAIATDMHAGISFKDGEEKLLKPGIDSRQVVNLLTKYADGVVSSFDGKSDIADTSGEVEECLGMLKEAVSA